MSDEPEDAPTKGEIDEFIKVNEIDERAATDLRNCTPEVQRKAAILVRIRDARYEGEAKRSGAVPGGAQMGLPSSREIDDFIKAGNLSKAASKALRTASPTVKRRILSNTSIRDAPDPSAVVLASLPNRRGLNASPLVVTEIRSLPTLQEVEDFLGNNEVDERAATDLRNSTPAVQQSVLSQGDLKSARNRSSALIGRIRDAKLDFRVAGKMDEAGGEGQPPNTGDYPNGAPQPMAGSPYGYPPPGYPGYPGFPGDPASGYPGYLGYPPAGYMGYPGGPPPGYPGYPPTGPPPGGYPPGNYPVPGSYPKSASPAVGQFGQALEENDGSCSYSGSYYSYSYTPSPSRSPPPPPPPARLPTPSPSRSRSRSVRVGRRGGGAGERRSDRRGERRCERRGGSRGGGRRGDGDRGGAERCTGDRGDSDRNGGARDGGRRGSGKHRRG
eukprot:TRINITY_DN35852_c0_g1_i1.p1 TRINITY_DN35852_c0_g1~~TRINITY_DN35852_c0_g1_i1.p1  ORF type:complete len:442 (+),score=67.90 TRINITY_DN35852_c0_g1_i1:231-1556(+)